MVLGEDHVPISAFSEALNERSYGRRLIYSDQCGGGNVLPLFAEPNTRVLTLGAGRDLVACGILSPHLLSEAVPDKDDDGIITLSERLEYAEDQAKISLPFQYYNPGASLSLGGKEDRSPAYSPQVQWFKNTEAFDAKLQALPPYEWALVVFSSTQCDACQAYKPELSQIAASLGGHIPVIGLEVEKGQENQLEKYSVTSVPTLAWMSREQKIIQVQDRTDPLRDLSNTALKTVSERLQSYLNLLTNGKDKDIQRLAGRNLARFVSESPQEVLNFLMSHLYDQSGKPSSLNTTLFEILRRSESDDTGSVNLRSMKRNYGVYALAIEDPRSSDTLLMGALELYGGSRCTGPTNENCAIFKGLDNLLGVERPLSVKQPAVRHLLNKLYHGNEDVIRNNWKAVSSVITTLFEKNDPEALSLVARLPEDLCILFAFSIQQMIQNFFESKSPASIIHGLNAISALPSVLSQTFKSDVSVVLNTYRAAVGNDELLVFLRCLGTQWHMEQAGDSIALLSPYLDDWRPDVQNFAMSFLLGKSLNFSSEMKDRITPKLNPATDTKVLLNILDSFATRLKSKSEIYISDDTVAYVQNCLQTVIDDPIFPISIRYMAWRYLHPRSQRVRERGYVYLQEQASSIRSFKMTEDDLRAIASEPLIPELEHYLIQHFLTEEREKER